MNFRSFWDLRYQNSSAVRSAHGRAVFYRCFLIFKLFTKFSLYGNVVMITLCRGYGNVIPRRERIIYKFTREKSETVDRHDELHVFRKHSGEKTDPGNV